MVLPFHRHFKWLCLEGLQPSDIQSYYDGIQFAKPDRDDFAEAAEQVKSLMLPPITKRRLVKRLYSEEDRAVWKKYDLEEIYLHRMGKNDWSELGKILNHSVMRVALECCLIAKIPANELTQILPAVYYLPCSEGTIALFKKYFFDHEAMVKRDWQDYLNRIADDRYTHTRIFAALTKSREEVMHLVGLPTKIQFGAMLKSVLNTAHYRFDYYARQSSLEAQEEARKWGKLMIEAGEKHEKYGTTDATDFAAVLQTSFQYVDTEFETVTPEMISEIKPQLNAAQNDTPGGVPKPPDDPPTRPANDV